eukprot:SAG11_NODE_7452_length_1142_cov_1.016299_2_plen_206_part_00
MARACGGLRHEHYVFCKQLEREKEAERRSREVDARDGSAACMEVEDELEVRDDVDGCEGLLCRESDDSTVDMTWRRPVVTPAPMEERAGGTHEGADDYGRRRLPQAVFRRRQRAWRTRLEARGLREDTQYYLSAGGGVLRVVAMVLSFSFSFSGPSPSLGPSALLPSSLLPLPSPVRRRRRRACAAAAAAAAASGFIASIRPRSN